MGVCEPDELDRVAGIPIEDQCNVEPIRQGAECLDCGRVTLDDDIESDDDGNDCCPCGSTRLKWFEG
jgi:Zn finger protein HypA/HybF involved in hydrogenase expression